jgi:probable F420-dependent oxidoreductase
MRVGVAIPTWGPFADVEVLTDVLARVEELGFESAWFSDHVAIPSYATDRFWPPLFEPLALAAWALSRYDRLRVGTDVLVAPYRHPVLLAAMAGSIDRLSGGRLTLGLGVGYLRGEFAALEVPIDQRGTITDDVLDALRVLWEGEGPRSFTGDHFRFAGVLPAAEPASGVPLWIGGNGQKARARAASRGDGWHPLYPEPDDYAKGRSEIEAVRKGLGRSAPFTFSYSAALCRVLSRRRTDWPSGASAEPPLRPEYRYAPDFPTDDEGRPLLCGTAEQVAADIEAYRRSGVEHMVLRVWAGGSRSGLDGVMGQLERWRDVFEL